MNNKINMEDLYFIYQEFLEEGEEIINYSKGFIYTNKKRKIYIIQDEYEEFYGFNWNNEKKETKWWRNLKNEIFI